MEEGEPTMNHKPPYQEAPGIVVPKSVISYPYSPSRYFQSLFSIVANFNKEGFVGRPGL